MSFYGNITNAARNPIIIDRIYPNRLTMEQNQKTDGVFVGRYALVEYDRDFSRDAFRQGTLVDGVGYFGSTMITLKGVDGKDVLALQGIVDSNKITKDILSENKIILVAPGRRIDHTRIDHQYFKIVSWEQKYFTPASVDEYEEYSEGNKDIDSVTVYMINNKMAYLDSNAFKDNAIFKIDKNHIYNTNDADEIYNGTIEDEAVVWKEFSVDDNAYVANFTTDKNYYGSNRGYDSTVWLKTFTDGVEEYVKIADLNTLTPIMAICGDAPSVIPQSPYEDANNTNAYYKYHFPTPWGFRLKSSKNNLLMPEIKEDGTISDIGTAPSTSDNRIYPSDENIQWKGSFYDKEKEEIIDLYFDTETNTWGENIAQKAVPAAVYFNKAGFNPDKIAYSSDILDENSPSYNKDIADSGWTDGDRITLSASGYSGKLYNDHNGTAKKSPQIDTQELAIMLPSVGNAIANIWDMVYGGKDCDINIEKTGLRNKNIHWENAEYALLREGLRLLHEKFDLIELTEEELRNYLSNPSQKTYYYLDEYGKHVPIPPNRSDVDAAMEQYWSKDRKYFETSDGFTYDTTQIDTLAGCINTAHDLMGMIIVSNGDDFKTSKVNINGIDVDSYDDADENKIYYFQTDGTYRMKHETYGYKDVIYKYVETSITEDDYQPHTFYLDTTGTNIATGDYDSNKTYYKKIIDPDKNDPQYEEVILSPYESGKYTKTVAGDYIYDDSGIPKEDTTYYDVTPPSQPQVITTSYLPYKYYAYEVNGDYSLSMDEEPEPGSSYFLIDFENKEKTFKVSSNLFNKDQYMVDSDLNGMMNTGEYNPETGEYIYTPIVYIYTPNRFYYKRYSLVEAITEEEFNNNAGKYFLRLPRPENSYSDDSHLYEDYYYQVAKEYDSEAQYYKEGENLYCDSNDKPTFGRYYFLVDATVNKETIYEKDENGNLIVKEGYGNSVNIKGIYRIQIIPFRENAYYYIKGMTKYWIDQDYNIYLKEPEANEEGAEDDRIYQVVNLPTKWEVLTPQILDQHYKDQFDIEEGESPIYKDYYVITPELQGDFYVPNRYWYQPEGTRNWVKDRKKIATENRVYYSHVNAVKLQVEYYIPNHYYIEDYFNTGEFILDSSLDFDPNKTYYKKNALLCVKSDYCNIFSIGSGWSDAAEYVPASVDLAFKIFYYEMMPLIGFGRDLNTINGLILQTNKLLEQRDSKTRELTTIRGSINYINDIIKKFTTIKPNRIMVSDVYGRLTAGEVSDNNQGLIDMVVGGIGNKTKVTIQHKKLSGVDTTSNNILSVDQNLSIKTPLVDSCGHVIAWDTKNISLTLPSNLVTTSTTFEYGENENKTIAELTEKIKELENRIVELESNTSETI